MQKKKDCKCKHICKDCQFYVPPFYGNLNGGCKKEIGNTINCINGSEEVIMADPYEENKDGNCKYYKEKVIKQAQKFLEQLQKELQDDRFAQALAKELLAQIAGKNRSTSLAELIHMYQVSYCYEYDDDYEDDDYEYESLYNVLQKAEDVLKGKQIKARKTAKKKHWWQ